MHHFSYILNQFNINFNALSEFFYPVVFHYDLISTKILALLNYLSTVSDLAEIFAVCLVLAILITSGFVISSKVQEQSKQTSTANVLTNIYSITFRYFN